MIIFQDVLDFVVINIKKKNLVKYMYKILQIFFQKKIIVRVSLNCVQKKIVISIIHRI